MEQDRSTGRARGRAQGRGDRGRSERGRARARPNTASRQEQPQTFQPAQPQPTPASQQSTPSVPAATAQPPPPAAGAAGAVGATGGSHVETAVRSEVEGPRGGVGPRGDTQVRGGLSRKVTRFAFEENSYTRPSDNKRGTDGRPIQLLANYIPIKTLFGDEFNAFMFLCDWEPRVSPGARLKLIMQLASAHNWGGHTYDARTLFVRNPIHQGKDTIRFALTLPKRDGSELKVTLTMKLVGQVRRNSMEYFHLLNVIFNEGQRRMNLRQIHDDFFNPERFSTVNQMEFRTNRVLSTLQVWPGYTASIGSVDDSQLMLCVDVSHKVVATEHLAHTIHKMMSAGGGADQHKLNEIKNHLTGRTIYTQYNNRTWRVDDISFRLTIDDTFDTKDRQGNVIKKSYREYYRERYNVELHAASQPLVVTKPKKRDLQKYHRSRKEDVPLEDEIIYLPAEVCLLTGLTDRQREDFSLMKEIGKYTRQPPKERFDNLRDLAIDLRTKPNAANHFNNWGLEFHDRMVQLNGRMLDNISIHMTDSRSHAVGPVQHDRGGASWDTSLRSSGVIPRCPIDSNSWDVFYSKRDEQTAQNFLDCMRRVAGGLNCDLGSPGLVPLNQVNALKWAEEGQRRMQGKHFLLYILPRNDSGMYNVLKKCFCVDYPVITQCVVSRTISNPKKVMSVATKVLLQIACKLGYNGWSSPMHPKLQTAMIVGIDVYHKRKQASVQAAVFSYNTEHTQYFSSAVVDTTQMSELNPRIGFQFEQGLDYYFKRNKGRLPDRIIIYRDGVGDSMLTVVKETEISTIEKAVNRRYEAAGVPPPNIVFVVVKKRISTRLVSHVNGKVDNPPPGTVVDSVITKPNFCDFFLVSQATRQGTVTPTHYNKIYDNFKEVNKPQALPTNILQKLSYLLCHLYFNWPGAIRVPAPTHYAHRLAFLVGQNIQKTPDARLCDRLFYL